MIIGWLARFVVGERGLGSMPIFGGLTVRSWLTRFRRRLSTIPTLGSAEAYALWAGSYPPEAHNSFMRLEESTVRQQLPDLGGRRVLDAACGTGRYAQLARGRGASRVVGADSSLAMLRRGPGFPRARADLTALPFAAASFDVVICGLALGHLSPGQMPRALAELARVLDGRGTIVLSDFHPYLHWAGHRRTFTAPDGGRFNVEHHPHLVADYLRALAAAGLEVTELIEAPGMVEGREVPAVLVIAARPRRS
jgi:SAM-dependent methyltransferase